MDSSNGLEPITFILLGSGFESLAGWDRIRFNKWKSMNRILTDNRGRRSRLERREFSYIVHIPERRSGKERRGGFDRRLKPRKTKQ